MAIKTQMRLGQLTGSFGDVEGGIIDSRPRSSAPQFAEVILSSGSMVGVMSEVASSIKRITGAGQAFGGDIGVFEHANLQVKAPSGATKLTIGNPGQEADASLVLDGHQKDYYLGIDDGDDLLKIGRGAVVGTTTTLTLSATDALVTFGGNAAFANAATLGSAGRADLLKLNASDVQVKAGDSLKVDIIAESAANAGVSIDGVLIKDNDIVIPDNATIGSVSAPTAMTIDNAGVVAFLDDIKIKDGGTIGSASAAGAISIDAAGNVTLAADLTVSGDTVTINVADLQIEDKQIELNHPANGEAGRASNSGAGLYLSGSEVATDITFNALGDGGRMELSNDMGVKTGKSFFVDTNNVLSQTALGGTVLASSLTSVGTIASLVATTADINAGTIDNSVIGGATPAAGSFLAVVGTTGTYSGILDVNDTTAASAIGSAALTIDGGASIALDLLVGDDVSLLSDSAVLNFGADSDVSLTHQPDQGIRLNAAMKFEFNAPDTAIYKHSDTRLVLKSSDVAFVMAGVDGGAGNVLQTDGAGNLSFAAAGGAASAKKFVGTLTAAGPSGASVAGVAGFSAFDMRALNGTTAPHSLDVFVNGQLLVSCSAGDFGENEATISGNATGDYLLSEDFTGASTGDLKMTFNLETDDVVVVSVRG